MSTVAIPVPEATVPVKGEGRPTPWWGMVCLIMTEATLFAGLIGSYFFYRAASKQWPPPGIEEPKLTLSIIMSFVLWGSSIPMIFAERGIKRGNQARLRIGLIGAWIMGAAFLGYSMKDFSELHFRWGQNAYSSIYYTTVGLHTFHVFVGLVMSGVVQIKAWLGKFSEERHVTVQVYAMYWHFVDVVWLFVMPTFILSPHIK
ncbi:MAG: heme-copper oxidase subunit III [Acidimicrobiia bacterium]|nr:heme-copper oxidase subunit III [Acidimicrobiia bacterium]MBV9040682.1 heme-copper oxidase subunit III [Acidimicrobiia bacterium]